LKNKKAWMIKTFSLRNEVHQIRSEDEASVAHSLKKEKRQVYVPITWGELDSVEPDGIIMADAVKRIGGKDLWEVFW